MEPRQGRDHSRGDVVFPLRLVVQGTVRLDEADRHTERGGDAPEGLDLFDDQSFDLAPAGAASRAGRTPRDRVARVGTDDDALRWASDERAGS